MKNLRFIIGYIIGISIFGILLPFILIFLSKTLDQFINLYFISNFYIRLCVSLPVFCIGLIFAVWSTISLLLIGKGGPTDVFNVAISPRSQKLVIVGPYRYSRNPMVFGMLSVYFSISVFLNSFIDLLFCLSLIPMVIFYLKQTEENRLTKDFGEEFLLYKSKVAMIFPFTKRTKKKRNTIPDKH
jgi:protein-S-isoprenylcysteine O-methyltransferase Ste14